ncbi:MAG TPA: ChaN family lipoprotein [Vicinamibacterales bacterium]|nr:ChaN family lipoprotein [Vicinamibacterales bacterium]
MDLLLFPLMTVLAAAQQPPAPPPSNPHPTVVSTYVPERVYDTGRNTFSDLEAMLADLARADVVLVGEQHDDPNTHRLESAVLMGLLRRKVAITLSLEMFERDVQSVVDDYLAGRLTEEKFLEQSRAWPRYETDYRPLVEASKAHGWKVVAANVPRRLASAVAKAGLSALDELHEGERAHIARAIECPLDNYFERFEQTMDGHPGDDKLTPEERRARTERYYYSQCLKDETMAESIVSAFARREGSRGTIVHFNGAFHSDFGAGAAERVRRRLPGRRVAVVSILPVEDIDAITPEGEELKRAEYLVYTVK